MQGMCCSKQKPWAPARRGGLVLPRHLPFSPLLRHRPGWRAPRSPEQAPASAGPRGEASTDIGGTAPLLWHSSGSGITTPAAAESSAVRATAPSRSTAPHARLGNRRAPPTTEVRPTPPPSSGLVPPLSQ